VTRVQLFAMGFSKGAVQHRLAMRRMRRVHAGVYAVGHQRLTARGRHLAALLACGDGAALCRWSSAAVWDLGRWPAKVSVLVPSRYHRHLRGVIVHGTRSLDVPDVAVHEGFRCTSVARTLVDLAAVATPTQLERMLEQSLTLNVFDRSAFDEMLARSAGRRGIARLRRLIARLADEPVPVRSELERRFLALVRNASLPLPVVNGYIGEHQVDFHWPDHRLVVETDGRAFHDSPSAFVRDRRRDLDLELAGWHVLRFGWRQVLEEPERIAALLRTCSTA
jgi:very-short-patch-repair endonuclease